MDPAKTKLESAANFGAKRRKQLKFVTNPEVERYIDRIGQRILSTMGPQPFDYRFLSSKTPSSMPLRFLEDRFSFSPG